MAKQRAPLFSVSLAFAIGCVVGLDGWISITIAAVIAAITLVLWGLLRQREWPSLAAFYLLTIATGLTWTLLLANTVVPGDLRLLPEEKSDETTQWRGLVIAEPVSQMTSHTSRRSTGRVTFTLHVEAWRPTGGRLFDAPLDEPWQQADGDIRCTLTGAEDIHCGDRLEFSSALEPIPPPLVPGSFDAPTYYARQGIYYQASISPMNWRRTETGAGNWWQELSFRARDWAYERLQIGLEDDPRTADFLAGMLIGYRQEIPADIEQDFRRTGTIHVFAVSGQNIAELLLVVLILLQLCGFVRWRWAWALIPIVLLYCLLTGSPASAVRATFMAVTLLAAWRLGRPMSALGCWSLAFLGMMIWDPAMLLDPGAQLSFAIVLGLILITPPLLRWMIRPFEPDPYLPLSLLTKWQRRERWFWFATVGLLCTGIAAVISCEPITALTFHQVTPISIVANMVVVPLAGWITAIGTLSIFISIFCTPIAALLNNANWLFARILIWFVGWMAHQPGAMINVADLSTLRSPQPSFIVAPLQDSACLLVRDSGHAWLVNMGRESATPSATWHLLQFYGINRLDGAVLAQITMADNSGATAIVRDYSPRHLVVPVLTTRSPIQKTLSELGPAEAWMRGKAVDLGPDVSVEVLNPAADETATRADDRALVLLFHAGGQSLLWAGRISPTIQRQILAAHPGLRADVLVMGAESPPDPSWLQSLQVRHWLQIPFFAHPRSSIEVPDFCRVWELARTGAVEIHFDPSADKHPSEIELRAWIVQPR